ncbi:basal-body rod modification protein FlgD [Thiosulfatimonas sediminis]|uniref:Basal-body rod modification protein FlgD n=1 Tax=Thiosulfatimonas sediminis TaxID=2675054 RepID=A0A6F8PU00_9GAMM|nr:flagellar hook capping FlgD N-terminal domain-containing protein [Thiosulfatimonas sediminis]BBP45507.1 basal-body rod modification protein FlgD [Thiosulfatimonas sediminis]
MDISSLLSPNSSDYVASLQQGSSSASSAPDQVMGQADFLRLLTTQLQNQDPSKPMDPTSFVTDLTQMSQLESTVRMNESILAMTSSFQNIQTMQAASMIGKSVQVEGSMFTHTQNEASQFRLKTDKPMNDVALVVSDKDGKVREISIGTLAAGEKNFSWDGKDDLGNVMNSGDYELTAYGTNDNGDLEMIGSVVASRVNSISVNSDGSMTLSLATGERISMDAVREISG